MKRRDVLKGVFAGAGAAAANAQHAGHGANPEPAQKRAAAPRAAWTPLLFDAHQNETVIALAELIIPRTDTPGAKEARVNEYIDLALNDGPAQRRNEFIEGLGWLDGHAIRKHQRPFVKCTAEQQAAILTELDAASDVALEQGADFFRLVKKVTVEGYYTSRIGIDELNKGGRVPQTFACRGKDH